MVVAEIQQKLAALGDPRIAAGSRRFFKTGLGEYGEGDLFRGIRVPVLRRFSRDYKSVTRFEAERLLRSPFHEDRLLALLLLVRLFSRGDDVAREKIYRLYLKNTRFINNWDLVDSSAEHIVGAFLWGKGQAQLAHLSESGVLWKRRIAIMATFHFIKRGEFDRTLVIAGKLLSDREDLIHKAVGWMLREVGKRDQQAEERFLRDHYKRMPRVMLRYAIEKFPEEKRRQYLNGEV